MKKNSYLFVFLLVVGAYFLGGYYGSSVKTEIKEVEKQVIKRSYVYREHPDGTKEIIYSDETQKEVSKDVKKTPLKKDWIVGVSTKLPFQEEYTFSVDRRILGNIYLGGYGTTQGDIGVGIKLLF